ncbi:MAG: hypothetical protein EA367_04700 [Leptolyngbya sp. DLM2.Bin15]|nr:MAG: hypothetical protein EA367_04700 [Leptolyngbya sp. DLM2.Bin15]
MSGRRLALLVGVSDYGAGYEPLPGTLADLAQMQAVLQDPHRGGFEVELLENPAPQQLREAIEHFFGGRRRDDVLLFYFSGHGALDNSTASQLYLSTCQTRKDGQRLVESSAVEAAWLHRHLMSSRSDQKVVVLDCCFSGAVANLLQKGDDSINLQQLKSKGTVLLASCNAYEVSYQDKEKSNVKQAQSLYTRYLIEGMQTGAARLGKTEWIYAQDLHDYAKQRFQTELAAAPEPQIIVVEKEGYRIPIARAELKDVAGDYRQLVAQVLKENDGEIDDLDRHYLEVERANLNVPSELAARILKEQQEPYRLRKRERARYYATALKIALKQGYLLTDRARTKLKRIQAALSLRDDEVTIIEQQVMTELSLQVLKPARKAVAHTTSPAERLDVTVGAPTDLMDLKDLHPGDYVVHQGHGIGRFLRSEYLTEQGRRQECAVLEFADGLLRVTIADLHALQRLTLDAQQNLPLSQMQVSAPQSSHLILDPLQSKKGVDYRTLRDLLQAGNWQAADDETYRVMLKCVGRKEGDWMRVEQLRGFPCTDLRTIDQLWTTYSQGHFGFSVQQSLYLDCGAKLDGDYPGDQIWEQFGDRVGWRVKNRWIYYQDVVFDLAAVRGHLPAKACVLVGVVDWWCWVLFSRMDACHISANSSGKN